MIKLVNYVFLSITLIQPAFAEVSFNDFFDAELSQFNETANRIASYHSEEQALTDIEQTNELQALATNVDAIITIQQNNPLYWFLKGLNENNMAELFHRLNDNDKTRLHISTRNRAYEKAMRLDENNSKLSASMYATMKHGLPEDLNIKAIQQELKLGGNGESESYYWYLHWSNVNALQQAGRQQEAEQALENMKLELQQQNVSLDDYHAMVDRVQHDLQQPVEKQPTPPVSVKDVQSAAAQAIDDEPTELPSKSAMIWIIVALSLVVMISLAIYEIVFRSRK